MASLCANPRLETNQYFYISITGNSFHSYSKMLLSNLSWWATSFWCETWQGNVEPSHPALRNGLVTKYD